MIGILPLLLGWGVFTRPSRQSDPYEAHHPSLSLGLGQPQKIFRGFFVEDLLFAEARVMLLL